MVDSITEICFKISLKKGDVCEALINWKPSSSGCEELEMHGPFCGAEIWIANNILENHIVAP